VENSSTDGGAVYLEYAWFSTVKNCTFVFNHAARGAGLTMVSPYMSPVSITNSIIAFSTSGEGVYWDGDGALNFECSDIYGNAGGDWVGYITDQLGQNGNIYLDPLFCDAENGDFSLMEGSPCLPDFNPDCGLIGAHGQGCGATPVIESARMDRFLNLCYPNPFNPSTTIRFSLPTALPIQLSIYTLGGKQLATLLHEAMPAGPHFVTWNGVDDQGRSVASGTYIYRLEAGDIVESKRMVLVR
jgi:hypothetical protein